MTDQTEDPVMGPVTVVYAPEEAAELSMLLQHVLHNFVGVNDPRPDQINRANTLGSAAVKIGAGMIQAMKDAGIPDEMIQRAMGNLQMTPQQTQAVEEVRAGMAEQLAQHAEANGNGEEISPEAEPAAPHPLDQATEPTIESPGIDFPAGKDPGDGTL